MRFVGRAVLLVMVAASSAAAQSPPPPRDSSLTARIDRIFAAYDRTDSPGCALGVVRDGRLEYARGYGMANLELGVAITPQSVFDIGSTSKQFTAMSVVLLARDGKLALDDDVRKLIPELPDYGKTITLRHLLNHTSGLRDYLTLMYLAGIDDADWTTDRDALDLIVRQRELNFAPGDQWLYSNTGFFLLSEVVKRASGETLARFAERRIFQPLGMRHTRFNDDHLSIVPNRATGYAPREGSPGRYATSMSNFEQTGDGAVLTSVEDLARWDQNFYAGQVGGAEALAMMQTHARLNGGRPSSYALGLWVDEYRGVPQVSHGGSWAGYRAELVRFPRQRTSVICLCNLATANPSQLARQVADLVLAETFARTDTVRAASPVYAVTTAALAGAADRARRFAGLYRNLETGELRRFTARADTLVVSQFGGRALTPHDSVTWSTVAGTTRIEWRFEPLPGAAQGMRARVRTSGGDESTLERVAEWAPTAAELAALAGMYESAELGGIRYTLAVEKGALMLRRRRADPTPLTPAYRDALTAPGLLLQFERTTGKVSGFSVNVGRTRNLRFRRIATG